MVVNKSPSPHRRRSMAVASHSQPSAVPHRRRAHSIAFRTSLSPQAKARRLLVPRKSILKTSFTAESLATQDGDVTESMELTQDFRTKIHDNASRKSLGPDRRVSFADHAQVRLFDISKNRNSRNRSPESSSPIASSESDLEPQAPPQVNNENDYPNANFARRRRSSVRSSLGSDMDMTTIGDYDYLGDSGDIGAAILDEDFDDFDDMPMSDDMDVTQAIPANIRRRSSVAPARRETLGHPPSAILQMDEDEGEITQSSIADDSFISETFEEGDKSQQMEFTVPMGVSLRPPAHEDEVWLALRKATHSGDTPIEPHEESFDEEYNPGSAPGEMPLDDAVQRLMRARDSMSHQAPFDETNNGNEYQEDTVSSVDSLGDGDNDNRTMNLTRYSIGGNTNGRMSMGYGEASMDESEVYGNIVAGNSRRSLAPNPVQEPANQPKNPPPSVFHPPPAPNATNPPNPAQQPTPTPIVMPRVFPQAPASPAKARPPVVAPSSASKGKGKPTFTAAFAPPTVRPSSPKKVPSKRLQREESDIENINADKPSPAKRQALAEKWMDASDKSNTASTSESSTAKPKPLSPRKRALFQSPAQTTQRPQANLRQPSGYMARRKSLATGLAPQASTSQSPRKRTITAGRASMGSASQDAWKRFERSAPLPKRVVETSQPEPTEEDEPVPAQPSVVSVVRHSPTPERTEEPSKSVDLSMALQGPTFGEMDEDQVSPSDKAERWRAGVEDGEYDEQEGPAISIVQFFDMTGIKFMDEIAAPRRSIHPGQQPLRRPRAPQDIGPSEYAVAMAIDVPQLELYTRVSRDLEAWMGKSKAAFSEAEEEAAMVTPELFLEYSKADEEGQAELLHQLNFIKTNARGSAKSDWYDWKLKWVEGLKMTADKAFADLQSDAKKLEVLSAAAGDLIPDLEKEYEEIMAELEREQEEVAEIEASDQDYLNELKASVAEQNIEVEALKAEVVESREQLSWLNERLRETEQQKQQVSSAIAKAERVLKIQKSSTRAEVFQLKDELEALEDLHLTRIIKVNAQLFEYTYDSTYRVSIPCSNFTPIVSKIAINRLEQSRSHRDDFPKLTNLFIACASEVVDDGPGQTVSQIVHKLGDYWTSCGQLRSHLRLLSIKYPVDLEIAPPSSKTPTPTFKARASLMFPKVMGKAFVSFIFNLHTFSEWPLSIDSLNCEVDVAYGSLDRSSILKAVVDRLAQATPSDSFALLDSCIEAQALYI